MDKSPFLLVTEYLENGDLKNFLKKDEAKTKTKFDKLVRISENVSGITHYISLFIQVIKPKYRIIRLNDSYTTYSYG